MNKNNLEKAADRAVTPNRRNMPWHVFASYVPEYRPGTDQFGNPVTVPYLVAPPPVFEFRALPEDPANPDGPTRVFVDGDKVIDPVRLYAPLQTPRVLLALANVGDKLHRPEKRQGEHPLGLMYDFAREYGL